MIEIANERLTVDGKSWEDFEPGTWTRDIDVRDFILRNYTPYEGDGSFLAGPTERTRKLWKKVLDGMKREREQGGTLEVDTSIVSSIVSHAPGYIDRDSS